MADNPIRKLIQLVLDRTAARRTEEDAKKTTKGIEGGLDRLKKAAVAMGAALVAAFGLHAMKRFFSESMRMAREEEAAWASLGSTIDAALGEGKWRELEGDLRALSAAFQEASTVGDDVFASGLQQMIAITGDVDASVNNMGLAVNVAARYFNGELGPAIDLVARVSTGFTRQLKTLGIQAETAQEGLDILAQRSLGAAGDALATTSGRLAQLNNYWGDFREAIGFAIMAGQDGGSVLETLRNLFFNLTQWVDRNRDSIGKWANFMAMTVVYAVNAVYQTVAGLGDLMFSVFGVTVGTVTRGLALLAKGFALVAEGGAKAAKFMGLEGAAKGIDEFADKVKRLAQEVDNYGAALFDVGMESGRSAKGRSFRVNLRSPPPSEGVPIKRPMVAAGADTGEGEGEKEKKEELTEAEKRLNEARERGAQLTEQMRTPTQQYIDTLQELERLLALEAISQETYNRAVAKAKEEFDKLTESPVAEVMRKHGEALTANATLATVLGSEFNALEAEEQALLSTIQELASNGVDPLDESMVRLVDRLGEVQEGMKRTAQETQIAGMIAEAVGDTVGAAFGGEIPRMAATKARQNAILAAEQLAYAAAAAAGLVTGVTVPKHLAAAKMYASVAAAWGGFAAVTGGFSGGGGGAPASATRDTGGARAERAQQQGADVTIVLAGDFDALSPRVQRVMAGAQKEWGKNAGRADVRILRRKSR